MPHITTHMNDVLGQAIHDHYQNLNVDDLWIHNKYGPKEEMPVDVFFRDEEEMPDMELLALNECRGKILDIGAGAGSHTLLLQNSGFDVTAIDISALAVQVMRDRGVKNAFEADVFNYKADRFDTLLLLMNGIGLAGTLDGLRSLLLHLKLLLNEGGQLLFDSSDVAYLYEGNLPANGYYGQIAYQYQYKKIKTDWFNWLYIDKQTLQTIADETGYKLQLLEEDEYSQYLARLVL